MSRLSQAIAYLNLDSKKLSNDWIKANLTDLTITDSLKKERRKSKTRTK